MSTRKQKVVPGTYVSDAQQCDHRAGITSDQFSFPLLVKNREKKKMIYTILTPSNNYYN